MPYALLDDQFHSNPKVLAAGLDGAGLYARALSYCGDYTTEGYVPGSWARGAVGRRKTLLQRLVDVGLWTPVNAGEVIEAEDRTTNRVHIVCTETGFYIDDYLAYNLSNAERETTKKKKSNAGRKGADKRWGDSSSHTTSHDTSHDAAIANGWLGDSKPMATRARIPYPFSSKEESAAAVPTPAAADELLDKLKSKGWDTDQLAAASDDPERAAAWLEVAGREARSNVGAYAWSGFEAGSWPVRDVAEKPAPPAACVSCGIGGGAHASDCELAEPQDPVDDDHVDERGLVLLVATLVKAGAGAQQVGERAERWARERTDDPVEVGRLILRSGELFAAAGASSTGEAA